MELWAEYRLPICVKYAADEESCDEDLIELFHADDRGAIR